MKIKELVPDIELCKLIPKGEFEDSAFQWQEATIKGKVCVDIIQHYPLEWEHPEWAELYPAPTLEEIMAKLPSCVCYRMNEEWSVGLVNDSAENAIKDSSGAAAALKLWLELKGIDYGK